MIESQTRTFKRFRLNASVLWLALVQAVTALGVWAAASGGQFFRGFALGSITLSMLTALALSFEAGLTAMVLFEPFRGFLRRAQYLIVPYSQNEPIHLITPFVTISAFAFLLLRYKFEIFRATPLAKTVSILAAICLLQVFNPLQGGLYVGLVGALFFLVPMAWFYFGQAAGGDFVPKILRLIVVLGIISSLYGVYQLIFGYPFFEQIWIDNTDKYSSISVYDVQRPLATFNNSEEWGRYVQIGCIVSAGLFFARSEGNKRVLWLGTAAVLMGMLAITGQRTSIFGLLLGLAILFVTGTREFGGIVKRSLFLLVPFILFVALVNPLTDDDAGDGDKVDAMVTHTSKGLRNPANEGSLHVRLETWTEIITERLPSNPIGTGLGTITLASTRNQKDDNDRAIDNHFLILALSAGVIAAVLLFWILWRAFVLCWRGWRNCEPHSAQADLWRIMFALSATFILNNFFGTSFTIYSIAPVGWLVVGWISANYDEIQNSPTDI